MYYILKALGYLFYRVRAGNSELVTNLVDFKSLPNEIIITSPQFEDNGYMPIECAGKGVGEDKSPSLKITVPDNEAISSLVIVCQDIDAPLPHPITHLVAYNIDPKSKAFESGELNYSENANFKFGYSFRSVIGYMGPRPIPGHGDHRYVFQIFAIDKNATSKLNSLTETPTKDIVIDEIKNHTICVGSITGLYKRD